MSSNPFMSFLLNRSARFLRTALFFSLRLAELPAGALVVMEHLSANTAGAGNTGG
jgi:hypothetical protein